MKKDNTIRILILEDDLEALSVLMKNLYILEQNLPYTLLAITVFSEYTQVESYVNKVSDSSFDVILLDRDCRMGGSFHVLNFKKFNTDKIISISTVPEWNNEAVEKGVKKICWKGHDNIEDWGERIAEFIKNMLMNQEEEL